MLRAVPRALVASRVWALAGFVGLAGGVACGVVTGAPSAAFGGVAEDAGLFEDSSSGAVEDVASSCQPSDVLTFVPGAYQPAVPPSGACLGADGGGLWDDFYDACLGPDKNNERCTAFKQTPANAACAACVLTPDTASQLGPILSYGQFVGGNVAGCIEITTPGHLSCAKAVEGLSDCETAACQANCPVTDQASLGAWQMCVAQADQAGCQSWFKMASECRAAEADAGLAAPCLASAFKDFYDDVVPLFCGQAVADAGVVPLFDAGASDAGAAASDAAGDQSAPDAGSD
jgi:hypothetical protein